MKKAMILLAALALPGCASFDWDRAWAGAAAGYAGASASYWQPAPAVVIQQKPPPVACFSSANGRQAWCY